MYGYPFFFFFFVFFKVYLISLLSNFSESLRAFHVQAPFKKNFGITFTISPPPLFTAFQLILLTLGLCHTTQPDENEVAYLDINLDSIPANFIQRSNRLRDRYYTAAVRLEIHIFVSVRVTVKCGKTTLRDYRTSL